MVPSSDASWGPPEPQPSQPWGHAGSAASTVAAAAAAIGFYAHLEYPPDAEPGSTFSTVLEHLPRKVQLEIHHRLGSSAAVPSNVVTRGDSLGLNFRLRMSDPGDTSVARRMARLSCKAGSEASFSNIAIDGKPEKDIKGSDPRLWSRLWSKAQGRAVLEFHVQCSDKGLACARTTTVQSLWKQRVAERTVARLRFNIMVLAPRMGKRWLARARAAIAAKRQASLELEATMKPRAASTVSRAFGDGSLELLEDPTLLDAALAEDEQPMLSLGSRARRNWVMGVRGALMQKSSTSNTTVK
mmetsp:Transcript_4802/g.7506  ORF Transcript_4802/g.7506 Transcript_4802/m.7506 type:complete len:299 (+) Transcript_4802:1-897(+)